VKFVVASGLRKFLTCVIWVFSMHNDLSGKCGGSNPSQSLRARLRRGLLGSGVITFPLLFFLSAQLISSTATSMISPVLPLYVREKGFSIVDLGIITTGFGAGLMIFEPIFGALADRIGAKKIFIVSILLTSSIIFGYTLARDLATFAALEFIQGILGAVGAVCSRVLAYRAFRVGGRASGAWYTILNAARLIGPAIGGFAATMSYNLAFYVAAIVAVLAFFLSFGISSSNKELCRDDKNGASLDKNGRIALIITSSISVMPMFIIYFYVTFVPVFAKEKLLLSPLDIGLVLAIYGAMGLLTSLFFGEASERYGKTKVIIIGMLLEASSFLLLPLATGTATLALTAVALGLGNAAVNPPLMALLVENIPKSKHGIALGLYGGAQDIGIMGGPLIGGVVYQVFGAIISFYLTAGLVFLNIVLGLVLLGSIRKRSGNMHSSS
jgi:MFS family permease